MVKQNNRLRPTELIQFLSLNQNDLIFVQESHLFPDSTFLVPGYKTLKKDRSVTRRGTRTLRKIYEVVFLYWSKTV